MHAWNSEWELPGGSSWWNTFPDVENEVIGQDVDAVLAKEAYELVTCEWDPCQGIPVSLDRLVEGHDILMMTRMTSTEDNMNNDED